MGMAKYLNKEMFLQSMGLVGDETKYGNRDGEHQSRSYSTWMGYEIMGSVDDSEIDEDLVEVPCRCKDCIYWRHYDHVGCTKFAKVCTLANYMIGATGYCLYGKRKGDGNG